MHRSHLAPLGMVATKENKLELLLGEQPTYAVLSSDHSAGSHFWTERRNRLKCPIAPWFRSGLERLLPGRDSGWRTGETEPQETFTMRGYSSAKTARG